MTDAAILWAVTVIAAVAIFYIWTSRPDHRRQEADGNQSHLPVAIHRELGQVPQTQR